MLGPVPGLEPKLEPGLATGTGVSGGSSCMRVRQAPASPVADVPVGGEDLFAPDTRQLTTDPHLHPRNFAEPRRMPWGDEPRSCIAHESPGCLLSQWRGKTTSIG